MRRLISPLTHANVGANGADWMRCNLPLLADGDRDLLWLPMSHIFGYGELCVGNTLGYETYLARVPARRRRAAGAAVTRSMCAICAACTMCRRTCWSRPIPKRNIGRIC